MENTFIPGAGAPGEDDLSGYHQPFLRFHEPNPLKALEEAVNHNQLIFLSKPERSGGGDPV